MSQNTWQPLEAIRGKEQTHLGDLEGASSSNTMILAWNDLLIIAFWPSEL